jgi:hypothetical protein
MNAKDYELYNFALDRFTLHKELLDKELPLVRFGQMNILPKDKGKQLNIWACCYEQEEALEADILLDGKAVELIKLSDYRALASERNIHRDGYIGKSYKYPDTFKNGQTIKVVEKQTQIVIFEDVVS